ncbi:MAG: two-component system sensor histidine kinase NtrB, partial [Polyangiaceae bacterium]
TFSSAPGALGAGSIATHAFALGAATAVLWITAASYTTGPHGSIAVVLGAAALLAAALNDFGVACGTLGSAHLTDIGLAALVVGIATTASARYARVEGELAARSRELDGRTQELRRCYDDLRLIREELAKKEQLAVVGELAAVIAHEVRNPLAIIANAGAGLRKQALSWDDHETLLAILDEEAGRLNRLVSDLLRYARPISLQRTHVVLGDLLERALSPPRSSSKGIHVEIRREIQDGGIWGDASLLRQVFDNVIDNAVQAMGQGGTLTIRIRPATEDGIDGVAVDVIDTGEGMDTLVRSRALDPFFTTRPSGTGLGLAIVNRIVEAHGGHLGIESHSGEGTTATVFLPHGSSSDLPALRARISKSPSDPARSASGS